MLQLLSLHLPVFIGIRYTVANGGGSKSIASVLGLGLGIAVLIIVLSIGNGFERELEQRVLGLVPHATIHTNKPTSDWSSLANEILDSETGKDKIMAVAPLIEFQAVLVKGDEIKITSVNGINPEAEQKVSIVSEYMIEGSFDALIQKPDQQGRQNKFSIILGSLLADDLGVKLGDKVNLVLPETSISLAGVRPRFKNFTVVGLFEIGAEPDSSTAYIHISDAAKLKRMKGMVPTLRLKLHNIYDAAYDVWALTEFLNGASGSSNEQSAIRSPAASDRQWYGKDWTVSHGGLYEVIRMSRSVVSLLVLLIIVVAAFNIVSNLIMMVNEKRSDIAILTSAGLAPFSIIQIFIVQGLLIGVLGILIGAATGFLVLAYVGDFIVWLENSLQLDLTSSYPVHYLPVDIIATDIIWVAFLGLVLSFAATLYPAMLAQKVDPAVELKFE